MTASRMPCCLVTTSGKDVKFKKMNYKKRKDIADKIIELVQALWKDGEPEAPRPMTFIIVTGGRITLKAFEDYQKRSTTYESFFWLPDSCLKDMDTPSHIPMLREMFAIGCLLFQIFTGQKPWAGICNEAVATAQEIGDYPPEVLGLPHADYIRILSLWSPEFAVALAKEAQKREQNQKLGKIGKKITTGIAVAGGVIAGSMLLSPLIIPAIGFGAAGVGGGTLAASWQASLGLVEAGSLFAFLQSAGAGGAAAIGTLVATGTGATAAVTSSIVAGNALSTFVEAQDISKETIWKFFEENARKKERPPITIEVAPDADRETI